MEIHEHPKGMADKKRVSKDLENSCEYESVKNIRIPKKRAEIVRSFREQIEKTGKVRIEIGEEISIRGDSFRVFNASTVITAIGRGFSFEDACSLFDDYQLYVLPISKDKKTLLRIRARLIGRNGTVRKKIEELTRTRISIYGKTVSIIGKDENLETARVAVEKIMEGKPHVVVFKFLEAKNKG